MRVTILCVFVLLCTAPMGAVRLATEYVLDTVLTIPGRQGVACDGEYYYTSDTKGLYRLSKKGEVLDKNLAPFQNPDEANHFGDIDYHDGEIYCGLERFEYGQGKNISVAIYDAGTLKWKRNLPWRPESGQVEVSGLAVDRERNHVWMSDWVDSRWVYCYDLATGEYRTKMQCQPTPYWCQGIFVTDGKMLFAADDGDAKFLLPDNIYYCNLDSVPYYGLCEGREVVRDTPFSVKLTSKGVPETRTGAVPAGAIKGKVYNFREMNDFRRAGEIEGIAIDPSNGNLLVVNNRGTEIVLGMSQGPIDSEGYTEEIHELYVYRPIR